VRAYQNTQVVIRLFNMETGITYDRIYDLADGIIVAEREKGLGGL
jgi:hypothetical protein